MNNAQLAKRLDETEEELEGLRRQIENTSKAGAITVEDILNEARKDLDDETYEKLVERYVRKASGAKPKGFKKTLVSTWKAGWTGKATIVFAGVGSVVTIGFLLEGVGAVTGWDQVRVVKKFSQWYGGSPV